MTKKHSTTALTPADHKRQNDLYAEGHSYDYIIIGTGNSALTVGALLAHAGYKICMLEAHDIPGGYLQSFKMGDFYFCAQVHYIWGCGPGGRIYEFLKKIGLEKEITFEVMGPDYYDLMALPDGKKVPIPYGYDALVENIDKAYPGQKRSVQKFVDILQKIESEMSKFPDRKLTPWDYLTKWHKFLTLIQYRKKTLQEVFDECRLSREVQAVLCANAGDFMLPPNKLSIFSYIGLFGGYNTGSYYPTKHFQHYVDRLAQFITNHEGCHIYYETEVTNIKTEGDRVVGLKTKEGKIFAAKNYICNMDPQKALTLVDGENVTRKKGKELSYDYSSSGVVVYLGLKDDIDLRDYGFGSFNIWHLEQWDMNKMWDEMAEGNFKNPWVFMSTPTLHTNEGGTSPKGQQILELASYIEYEPFKARQEKSYADYSRFKMEIADRMLDIVEKKYIPNLRDHIAVKVIGTPVTNEDFVMATRGNAYGSAMTPANVSTGRLKADSPWKNLFWCNASSGWAGVYGTSVTGSNLYMKLTGDYFFQQGKAPSHLTMIADLKERIRRETAA